NEQVGESSDPGSSCAETGSRAGIARRPGPASRLAARRSGRAALVLPEFVRDPLQRPIRPPPVGSSFWLSAAGQDRSPTQPAQASTPAPQRGRALPHLYGAARAQALLCKRDEEAAAFRNGSAAGNTHDGYRILSLERGDFPTRPQKARDPLIGANGIRRRASGFSEKSSDNKEAPFSQWPRGALPRQ
ncbi:hypothetical protein E2320_022427, partial [Naja naja]